MHKGVLAGSAIALAVAAVLAVEFKKETFTQQSKDERIQKPILSSDTLKALTSFSIKNGDSSFTINKGESWTIASSSFPADTGKVVTLFSDLNKAKAQRVVATSKEDFASLELSDDKAKIITVNSGDKSTILRLGKSRTNGAGFYFAFADEAKAYESSTSLYVDTKAGDWESKELFKWIKDSAEGLTVSTINGADIGLSFKKNGENWDITAGGSEGDSPNSNNISNYLETIAELSFDKKVEKKSDIDVGIDLYNFKVNIGTSTLVIKITEKSNSKESKTYYISGLVENSTIQSAKNINTLSEKWLFEIEEYKINNLKEEISHFLAPKAQETKDSATKEKSGE